MKQAFYDFKIYKTPVPMADWEAQLRGHGEKKICIVFLVKDMADRDHKITFLEKIIAALKLDIDKDTTVLWLQQGKEPFPKLVDLKAKHTISKAIFFGLKHQDMGIHSTCHPYIAFPLAGMRILFADDLSAIESDPNKKKLLWNELQRMFS